MAKIEKDGLSGVETTGHEWDGIQELNNPLPRWWLYILYATIAWSVVYWVLYPAWPIGSTYTKGLLGWSQRGELEQSLIEAQKGQAKYIDQIKASTLEQIRNNQDLLNFAMAGGKAAFGVNCVQCHGAGGQGNPGYPNLTDDKWLWGGTPNDIYTTIKHGVRAVDDAETRPGVAMPAWATDSAPAKLAAAQINDVVEYVLSLNKTATDASAAARGAGIFNENCSACHGDKAQGNADMGVPALNNGIWLYSGEKKALLQVVSNGRAGVMPSWNKRLDDATIKELAVYVHELGGGQ
ncbi:Cbb3-type cytochrome c oxidase subunit CcoP [Azospirillaceae bacterium]